MKITNEADFYRIGQISSIMWENSSVTPKFSNKEVEEQIYVLTRFIKYLEGRLDAMLILPALKGELEMWVCELAERNL